MNLQTLLPTNELTEFRALIAQAGQAGAEAVKWHSSTHHVLLIGICAGGELVTWFASPAHTEAEAAVALAVVLAGLAQASNAMSEMQTGAAQSAHDAIKKAATRH